MTAAFIAWWALVLAVVGATVLRLRRIRRATRRSLTARRRHPREEWDRRVRARERQQP